MPVQSQTTALCHPFIVLFTPRIIWYSICNKNNQNQKPKNPAEFNRFVIYLTITFRITPEIPSISAVFQGPQ